MIKKWNQFSKEKVKFEKGGLLRVLKDSGFNHHKGSPKNELKHNRGQYIATIGKDNMGEVVHLDIYTPNTKRFLSSTSFDNPKKLADYFDKNQLYAKGGKTKKSKPAPRKPISIKRGRDRSSGLRRMYGFAKGGDIIKDKDKDGNDGYKVFAVVDNFDYENQDYDQLYYKTDDEEEITDILEEYKKSWRICRGYGGY